MGKWNLKLNNTEINAILSNEAIQCYKENILTKKEIVEYLTIIKAEIQTWNSLTSQLYWDGETNTKRGQREVLH